MCRAGSVFGESSFLRWLLLPPLSVFLFQLPTQRAFVKGWKLAGVLAKKPSASGWPGGAGEDLVEAGFPPPVIWEPIWQRSWGTSAEGPEGGGWGPDPSRASAVGLVPSRQGSSRGLREHRTGLCLLATLQGPWPSRRATSVTLGPQVVCTSGLHSQMAGCQS